MQRVCRSCQRRAIENRQVASYVMRCLIFHTKADTGRDGHVCRGDILHDWTSAEQNGANGQTPRAWETVNTGLRCSGIIRRGPRHKRTHDHVSALCSEHACASIRQARVVAQRGALGTAEKVLLCWNVSTGWRIAAANSICRRERRLVNVASRHVCLCARAPGVWSSRYGVQQQQRRAQRWSQRQRCCVVEFASSSQCRGNQPQRACELDGANCLCAFKLGRPVLLALPVVLSEKSCSPHRSRLFAHLCFCVSLCQP
jgi:hypothetical protein